MSYRPASTRKVSSAGVPVNRRLERVMEAGKLLRGLQLRSDLVATGVDTGDLKKPKPDQGGWSSSGDHRMLDAGPAGSLGNLPGELKAMIVRDLLMRMFKLSMKPVNREFNTLSKEFDNLTWDKAYEFLKFRFDTLGEEVLKLIVCHVLHIERHELRSTTPLNIQKLFEVAAYCFLKLPPFEFGLYEANSRTALELTYVSDTPTPLAYNHNLQRLSYGLLLEEFEAFVFAVCHGTLNELRNLAFESSKSNRGVTKFFSSVSNSALPNLEFLRIEDNRLGDDGMGVISTALKKGALQSLNILKIAENQIDDVGMASFSEAISDGAARSLEELSITGNRIGDTAFFSALSKLSNEQTRLSAPPDTVIATVHAQLQTLNLVCNQIGDDSTVELSNVLSEGFLPNLRRLGLGCNLIGDKGVIALVSALSIELGPESEIEVLEHLGLDGNPIGERGMKQLLSGRFPQASQRQNAERVSTTRKRLSYDIEHGVTRVDVWCSDFTFQSLIHSNFEWLYPERTIQVDDRLLDAIHAIVGELPRNPDKLSQAALAVVPGDRNARVPKKAPVDEAYKLLRMCAYYKLLRTRRFYLNDTRIIIPSLTDWLGDEYFKVVCFALCSGALRGLTHLDASSRHLNDEAMVTLSSTIATGALTELVDLTFKDNQIGYNGIMAFADAIKPSEAQGKLVNLNSLDISSNYIGDKGMEAFSSALDSGALASLENLNIGFNYIGGEGMKTFSGALSNGNLGSLTNLWLDGNQIGDKGMKTFSRALPGGALASLENLYIGSNQIGEKGMGAFARAIKPASNLRQGGLASLKVLCLKYNNIGGEGMSAFADAIKPTSEFPDGALQKLEQLNLDYNSIDDAGMLKFIEVLSSGRPEHLSHVHLWGNPASGNTIDRMHDAASKRSNQNTLLIYGIGNQWEQ